MKITKLEIENVKRVKALSINTVKNLTVIGGKNNQGKTSVLDAICFALGGNKFKPTKYKNTDSVGNPKIRIELDNGLIVERTGKNGSLKVTDSNGKVGGQTLLNEFVSQFALDLPKFLNSTDKEKAKILLSIIGVEKELFDLEQEEQKIYQERHTQGMITDQKNKYAKELVFYPEQPSELITASELIEQSQQILARNAERERLINELSNLKEKERQKIEILNNLRKQVEDLTGEIMLLSQQIDTAEKNPIPEQQSTAEIQKKIEDIELTNEKIRSNFEKQKAEEDAELLATKYKMLSDEIEDVRKKKLALLQNADLPLPNLSIIDSVLAYNGIKWDCMSNSEQLQVSTAIVQKLNPECNFVLMDKLEQLDAESLVIFEKWLTKNNIQVIGTRVSTGEECSIIIEDGIEKISKPKPKFNIGEF